jgi:hypothetical protein
MEFGIYGLKTATPGLMRKKKSLMATFYWLINNGGVLKL